MDQIVVCEQNLESIISRLGNARDLLSIVCNASDVDGQMEGALFGIIALLDAITHDLDADISSASALPSEEKVVA